LIMLYYGLVAKSLRNNIKKKNDSSLNLCNS
jgi:hypothetical protein